MLSRIELVQGRSIDLYYSDKVYDPTHTSIDVIYVADMFLPATARVLDVGCGSGVIALALKRLNPKTEIHAVDIDPEAVKLTKHNSKALKLKIEAWEGDLAEGRQNFHMVVANLPTFNDEDMETHALYGPKIAYKAGKKDGLTLYKKLLRQLPHALTPEGIFVCECRKDLQDKFEAYAHKKGWRTLMKTDNALAFIRT